MNLNGNSMRLYSDYEIDQFIEEILEAGREAIEKAAGEAAQAMALEMLEREAHALREVQRWRSEAERLRQEAERQRRSGIWNIVITGLACLASGLTIGLLIK